MPPARKKKPAPKRKRRKRLRADEVRCPTCKKKRRIRDELRKLKTDARAEYLANLKINLGATKAAERAGVSREAIRKAKERDPEFAELIEAAKEAPGDVAEMKLFQNIAGEGIPPAVRQRAIEFLLETKFKDRGYGKKSEVSIELLRAQATEDLKTLTDIFIGAVKQFVEDEGARDRIRAAILEGLPG